MDIHPKVDCCIFKSDDPGIEPLVSLDPSQQHQIGVLPPAWTLIVVFSKSDDPGTEPLVSLDPSWHCQIGALTPIRRLIVVFSTSDDPGITPRPLDLSSRWQILAWTSGQRLIVVFSKSYDPGIDPPPRLHCIHPGVSRFLCGNSPRSVGLFRKLIGSFGGCLANTKEHPLVDVSLLEIMVMVKND